MATNSKDYMNNYYHQHKDKFNQKIKCSCGSIINKYNANSHYKTKKHQNFIDYIKTKLS